MKKNISSPLMNIFILSIMNINFFNRLFLLCLCTSIVSGNEPRQYGWQVPDTSINIGGYIDAVYDDRAEDKFVFDDVALLISAYHNRFSFLSEIEISKLSLDGKSNGTSDIRVNIERLEVTYALSDNENLTFGRFNSDIGYWNQAPVNILQATTTKPHIFESVFPQHTTGVMYKNYFNDDDYYSITFQNNKDIGQADNSIVVNQHYAMSYYDEIDNFSWHFATGYYKEKKRKDEAYYVGLGAKYSVNRLSIQTEFYTQKYENTHQSYNVYIQSVWHMKPKQDIVLRVEKYDEQGLEDGVVVLGYAYRPTVNTALKVEYIHHSHDPDNRFVYSFSVLF